MKESFLNVAKKLHTWRSSELHSLTFFKNILFYLGLWSKATDHGGFLAYRIWLPKTILLNIIYNTFIGLPMKAYTSSGNDLKLTVESLAAIFISAAMLAGVYCLDYQTQLVEEMLCSLHEMRECGKRLPHQPEALLAQTKKWSEWTIGFVLGSFFGVLCFSFVIPPLIAQRQFVYFAWFPFDEKTSPFYEMVFVLSTTGFLFGIILVVCLYAMLEALLVEAIGQLKLLSYNLENIFTSTSTLSKTTNKCTKEHLSEKPTVTLKAIPYTLRTSFKGGTRTQRERHGPSALKILVHHHCLIQRYVGDIQSTFNIILLVLLSCVVAPTSLGLVLILYAEEIDRRLVFAIVLIIVSTFGTGLLCWLADRLTVESDSVCNAMYGSDWFNASSSFKSSMLIVIARCNVPIGVTVAGFIPLSSETFYSMVQLTYSYCMTTITYFQRDGDLTGR